MTNGRGAATMASFMTKKKKYKFQVDICLDELVEVPFVSAVLLAKVRLLDGGSFQDQSSREEVADHKVKWGARFSFPCKMFANASTGVLERCVLRISVRKECKGGRSFNKLGFVDVNLAEYAGAGLTHKRALLEGYDARHRQDNSMIRFSIEMNMLSGDILFKAPSPSLKHKSVVPEESAADSPRSEEFSGGSLGGSIASGSSGFGSLPKKRPALLSSDLVIGHTFMENTTVQPLGGTSVVSSISGSVIDENCDTINMQTCVNEIDDFGGGGVCCTNTAQTTSTITTTTTSTSGVGSCGGSSSVGETSSNMAGHSRNSSNTSQMSKASGYSSINSRSHSRQSSSGDSGHIRSVMPNTKYRPTSLPQQQQQQQKPTNQQNTPTFTRMNSYPNNRSRIPTTINQSAPSSPKNYNNNNNHKIGSNNIKNNFDKNHNNKNNIDQHSSIEDQMKPNSSPGLELNLSEISSGAEEDEYQTALMDNSQFISFDGCSRNSQNNAQTIAPVNNSNGNISSGTVANAGVLRSKSDFEIPRVCCNLPSSPSTLRVGSGGGGFFFKSDTLYSFLTPILKRRHAHSTPEYPQQRRPQSYEKGPKSPSCGGNNSSSNTNGFFKFPSPIVPSRTSLLRTLPETIRTTNSLNSLGGSGLGCGNGGVGGGLKAGACIAGCLHQQQHKQKDGRFFDNRQPERSVPHRKLLDNNSTAIIATSSGSGGGGGGGGGGISPVICIGVTGSTSLSNTNNNTTNTNNGDGGVGGGKLVPLTFSSNNECIVAAVSVPSDCFPMLTMRRPSVTNPSSSSIVLSETGSLDRAKAAYERRKKSSQNHDSDTYHHQNTLPGGGIGAPASSSSNSNVPPPVGRVENSRVNPDHLIAELLKDTNLEQTDESAENSGLQLFIAKDGTAALGNHDVKSQMSTGPQLFKQVVMDNNR